MKSFSTTRQRVTAFYVIQHFRERQKAFRTEYWRQSSKEIAFLKLHALSHSSKYSMIK
jgi:hypothetical protein